MNPKRVSTGEKVLVKYEDVVYRDGGWTEETVTREDTGYIVAVPSQRSEDFEFDYELKDGNAVRSVNLNSNIVSQLIYEAGGDRESESWDSVSVSFS